MPKPKSVGQPATTAPPPKKPKDAKSVALLGLALLVFGVLALLLPTQATIAASTGLGALLVFAGAATMVQAIADRGVEGFNWHLLAGAAEVVGGLLIWLSPLKGAAAIALLVVIIVAVQGLSHLVMAVKLRGSSGRIGLAAAGLASLVIALVLVLRFPYSSVSEPGAMAGIALVVAGLAHLMLAAARYRATPRPAP